MYISEKYLNVVGALVGAVKGAVKKVDNDPESEERISHWEQKLRDAKTDKEKETAQEKLKHWKRENRKRKLEAKQNNIKSRVKKDATRV